MNIDAAGHRYTAVSKEYRKAVNQADQLIGLYLHDWLAAGYQVIVTADHGMDEYGFAWRKHGCSSRSPPLYFFRYFSARLWDRKNESIRVGTTDLQFIKNRYF